MVFSPRDEFAESRKVPGGMSRRESSWMLLFLPYLALVSLHVILGLGIQRPYIFADELGYLGIARYLAGISHFPRLEGAAFYHFGYSLFLMPAFWVISDPNAVYRGVILINSFMLSALYFPLYYLLNTLFENTKRRSALLSCLTCLYPAFILQSNVAWAENAFIPVYALFIAVFGAFIRRQRYWVGILLGGTAGFLYAIHPRGLPVVVVSVLYLAAMVFVGRIPGRKGVLTIGSAITVFSMAWFMNEHLKNMGWETASQRSFHAALTELLFEVGWKNLILEAVGQIMYLSQATYGMFLLGLIYLLGIVRGRRRRGGAMDGAEGTNFHLLVLLFLSSLGIFLSSCIIMIHGGASSDFLLDVNSRGDHLIYGRYNEGFLPLYLVLGWMALGQEKNEGTRDLWVNSFIVAVIGILTLAFVAGFGYEAVSRLRVSSLGVLGIYPAIGLLRRLDPCLISLMSIGLFLVIRFVSKKSLAGGSILVSFLFFSVAVYGYVYGQLPLENWAKRNSSLAGHIRSLGPIDSLSYDLTFYDPNGFPSYFAYQYSLQNVAFETFRSDRGEIPKTSIVISGKNWRDAERLNARFLVSENVVDQALWVLTGGTSLKIPEREYINLVLGAEAVWGVWESGFHGQEWSGGRPVRWTNGAAKLVVPVDMRRLPTALQVEIQYTGPKGTNLQILVNGHEMYRKPVAAGRWSGTFQLDQMPARNRITIELTSDTFVPKETIAGSEDKRTLGVYVEAVKLLGKM